MIDPFANLAPVDPFAPSTANHGNNSNNSNNSFGGANNQAKPNNNPFAQTSMQSAHVNNGFGSLHLESQQGFGQGRPLQQQQQQQQAFGQAQQQGFGQQQGFSQQQVHRQQPAVAYNDSSFDIFGVASAVPAPVAATSSVFAPINAAQSQSRAQSSAPGASFDPFGSADPFAAPPVPAAGPVDPFGATDPFASTNVSTHATKPAPGGFGNTKTNSSGGGFGSRGSNLDSLCQVYGIQTPGAVDDEREDEASQGSGSGPGSGTRMGGAASGRSGLGSPHSAASSSKSVDRESLRSRVLCGSLLARFDTLGLLPTGRWQEVYWALDNDHLFLYRDRGDYFGCYRPGNPYGSLKMISISGSSKPLLPLKTKEYAGLGRLTTFMLVDAGEFGQFNVAKFASDDYKAAEHLAVCIGNLARTKKHGGY
jgi:hypothetical protein